MSIYEANIARSPSKKYLDLESDKFFDFSSSSSLIPHPQLGMHDTQGTALPDHISALSAYHLVSAYSYDTLRASTLLITQLFVSALNLLLAKSHIVDRFI